MVPANTKVLSIQGVSHSSSNKIENKLLVHVICVNFFNFRK